MQIEQQQPHLPPWTQSGLLLLYDAPEVKLQEALTPLSAATLPLQDRIKHGVRTMKAPFPLLCSIRQLLQIIHAHKIRNILDRKVIIACGLKIGLVHICFQ